MDCNTGKQSTEKRFFLGDSDSEDDSEWDEPKERCPSMSGSECSDCVVGGVPTNLQFDDDSGLGMSIGSEHDESIEDSDSAQILPIRPVSIGKSPSSKHEHKQHRTRRSKKYHFNEFYEMKNDSLGQGAYASVYTCVSIETGVEYAVKLVNKHEPGHTRSRILREVDVFKLSRNNPNIVQLIEWFEDDDYFYMVFEKMAGGQLLSQIQNKICFNENEAAQVTKDIANALKFLHSKGVAHRDLKPENVLCVSSNNVSPVKLCDLDLASKPTGSSLRRASRQLQSVQSEPDLTSPVGSAEFLAPEVVETFVGESLKYNRQCDMWSLGVITYIMLCGYVPFFGGCAKADSCGWNQGQACDDCQEDLFEKIREGSFEYPEDEWKNISDDAKDLISHLLVKDVHKRYTANDVLQHPWINSAPKTLLQTANNLFRNNSTKDIQQYQDHFNLNHFTSRLSSRVEETIPSLGSTPENESALEYAMAAKSNELAVEASKLLEQQFNEDSLMEYPPAYLQQSNDLSAMNQQVYYPQLMNMNGVMIYPPQMAILQNPNINYQQQAYNPEKKAEVELGRATSNVTLPRALTPVQLDSKLQQHRGSLSTAISQLGLETCQNAMVRQSSGKEIHQTRETQVNV